ncbi:MAG: hypothetical protein ACLTDV_01665 [Eubacterium sp.]
MAESRNSIREKQRQMEVMEKSGSSSLGKRAVIPLWTREWLMPLSKEVTYASCGSVINKHYNFSGKAGAPLHR